MAPHSSFPAPVAGWPVNPGSFSFGAGYDLPSQGAFPGPEPSFSPVFGPYVPGPFLQPGSMAYPGLFPGDAFPGPFLPPNSGYVKPFPASESSRPPHHPQLAPLSQQQIPPSFSQSDSDSLQDKLDGLALNPKAKEYVPPEEHREKRGFGFGRKPFGQAGPPKSGMTGRRKVNMQKQLNEKVRRTVYICDIDQSVTEEELAEIFDECGKVQDCRVCGDPNSAMRFAFIEFEDEKAVPKALAKAGLKIGPFSLRILPSKTAIVPVNNKFLPKSEEERELCSRTIYVANIDKCADKRDVKAFFENLCGHVTKLRLLGDFQHASRIAFVEFEEADSANRALDISGALLGMLPLRISPSKTPVRSSQTDIGAEHPSERHTRRILGEPGHTALGRP